MSRAWVLDEAVAGAGGTGGPQVSTSAGNGSSLVGALVLCGSASCDNSPVALLGKKLPMKAQEGVQVSGSPQAGQNPPPRLPTQQVGLLSGAHHGTRLFGGTEMLGWAEGSQALSGPQCGG